MERQSLKSVYVTSILWLIELLFELNIYYVRHFYVVCIKCPI